MTNRPWCSQHQCHPSDCFDKHNPDASKEHAPSEEETRLAIIREHTERQNENIKREQAKMSRSVVDARKIFEEAKERHEKGA